MSSTIPPKHSRPLSPHLSIYRFSASMLMSILHRVTGVALAGSSLIFLSWLIALYSGAEIYQQWVNSFTTIPGYFILFSINYIFFHHLFGGIRHFILDSGYGYNTRTITQLAHLTWLFALVMTIATWSYIYYAIT